MEGRPNSVLFACNLNAVRSPMAEALMKLLFGVQVYVDSCGLRRPAKVHDDVRDEEVDAGVDPFAQAVMAEIGVDLAFGPDGLPSFGKALNQGLEGGIGNENLAGPCQPAELGGKIDRLADG